MDWLAALSTEWVLAVAFVLGVARLGVAALRRQIGVKTDQNVGELIESLLFAWVTVFLIVRPFFFEPFRIPSTSMVPTLNVGDRIVVNRYLYRLHPPQRGDVIVFKSPPAALKDEADFVKRLIGLPGDKIDLRNGDVYLNDQPLKEPYTPGSHITESLEGPENPAALHFPYRVPPGRYLMMGDNREVSFDSRGWGIIEAWRIKGKAVLKFWPPKDFGRIR